MENLNLINWLKENGGNAIKLLMIKDDLIAKDSYDINELATGILMHEEIQKELDFFDQFKEYPNNLSALVHNTYANCFERFMPTLLSLGFQKGIKVFDEKIQYIEKIYTLSAEGDLKNNVMPFTSIIIIWHLLKAGYYTKDIEKYVIHRLLHIHKVSNLNKFDFYEEDETKIRQLSKWKDKIILKDIYNPYLYNQNEETYPLPIIYDIKLILYFYDKTNNQEVKNKIDDIMRFVLNPLYQEKEGYYGWHWDFTKKTYHATTSGYALPLYNNDEPKNLAWFFLDYLDLATYSKVLLKSDWYKKCLNFLEQFKTEKGTYLFPENFLDYLTYNNPIPKSIFYKLFISDEVKVTLKRNDIKNKDLEIYSTYLMVKFKSKLDLK